VYVGILWKVGNTHKIAVIPVEVDEFSGRRNNAFKNGNISSRNAEFFG
jgi:hypothetical protein